MNEYSVRLAENVYTQGNILIAGALSTGKTTLMRDIGDQLKKKGFSVELVTPTPIDGERDYTENFMLTKEFASRLKEYDALLDDRLKTMAAAHVGYYTKANLMPIALIINDFDEYMNDDDYKSVDTIKSIIARIGRLGLRCGILLIIGVIRPSGSIISSQLKICIDTSIILGPFNDMISMLMFDVDYSNIGRKENDGVIKTRESFEVQLFDKTQVSTF